MILEIINPSDCVLIECDDVNIAAVAIFWACKGMYGLTDTATGESVLPILAFSDEAQITAWLKEKGIDNMSDYLAKNKDKIVAVLDSATTCGVDTYRTFKRLIEAAPNEAEKKKLYEIWDDEHRSSMNQIANNLKKTAENLRNWKG